MPLLVKRKTLKSIVHFDIGAGDYQSTETQVLQSLIAGTPGLLESCASPAVEVSELSSPMYKALWGGEREGGFTGEGTEQSGWSSQIERSPLLEYIASRTTTCSTSREADLNRSQHNTCTSPQWIHIPDYSLHRSLCFVGIWPVPEGSDSVSARFPS